LLQLRNLLALELAREPVEQLAKRIISYLIVDLFIDSACVSDEILDKGGGEVRGPAGMYQNANSSLSPHPLGQTAILLHPIWDALVVQ